MRWQRGNAACQKFTSVLYGEKINSVSSTSGRPCSVILLTTRYRQSSEPMFWFATSCARGYPMADFEHRAEDISVDHPDVVQNFRAAHAIAERGKPGNVSLRAELLLLFIGAGLVVGNHAWTHLTLGIRQPASAIAAKVLVGRAACRVDEKTGWSHFLPSDHCGAETRLADRAGPGCATLIQ
jgi:hypothetical protein